MILIRLRLEIHYYPSVALVPPGSCRHHHQIDNKVISKIIISIPPSYLLIPTWFPSLFPLGTNHVQDTRECYVPDDTKLKSIGSHSADGSCHFAGVFLNSHAQALLKPPPPQKKKILSLFLLSIPCLPFLGVSCLSSSPLFPNITLSLF